MSSTHYVRIQSASKNSSLICYFSHNGSFPHYFQFDKNWNAVPPETEDIHREKLIPGKRSDEFRNKPVTHFYLTGVIDMTPFSVAGLTISEPVPQVSSYRQARHYLNGKDLGSALLVPGYGYKGTGVYSKVLVATATQTIWDDYHSSGNKLDTVTQELVSISAPKGPMDSVVYVVSLRYEYTQWAKDNHLGTDVKSTVTYTGYLNRLGTATKTTDLSSIKTRLISFPIGGTKPPIAPNDILDDIYSKLTLPDVNNCENLKDLKDIKKSIPPIADVIKKKNLKSLSGLYLWYKYSYSTTTMDLKSYYKYICKWLSEVSNPPRSDYKHISITKTASFDDSIGYISQLTRYNIYMNTFNCGVFRSLGLDLNMSNTWDLIPLSFVVDWFINFGDILRRLDQNDLISSIGIRSVLTSNKNILTYYPLSDMGVYTGVLFVIYTRTVDKALPIQDISVSLKNPIHHSIDGTALFVSNKRSK